MPPSKKTSRGKKRPAEEANSQEFDEPSIETLAENLEQQQRPTTSSESSTRQSRQNSVKSSAASVLKAPEALSNDLIQEMRFELDTMRKLRSEHQQEMISIQSKLASKSQDNFQWKKDGNRKQFEVMQKIVEQGVQSRALYQTAGQSAGESQLSALIVAAQDRIKLLKIADSSPHGWGTVAEYEANPITQGEEDDKKLKKAEKAAQEKSALRLQERQAKQARFSRPGQGNNYQNHNYRNQYGGQNNNSPNYRAYGGFKNGNPYKTSTVTQDKNPPRRNSQPRSCLLLTSLLAFLFTY